MPHRVGAHQNVSLVHAVFVGPLASCWQRCARRSAGSP
jgi:hypothetical protein